MKVKLLTSILATLFLLACKKEKPTSSEILTSTKWRMSLIDKNPASNPSSGNVLYYAVQDCERDDTFGFNSNGKLTINRGAVKCDAAEKGIETKTYSIDRTSKKLVIDDIIYTLVEETNKQIKYYANLPASTNFHYIVFLLEPL